MKFNIGFLSKIYSVTPQTIHHYEKLGLLNSSRTEENGYRYYDSYNFQKLGTIKKLRNAGFSLKDSFHVHHANTTKDVIHHYQNRKREAYEELQKLQQVIVQLDYDIECMTNVIDHPAPFRVIQGGPFYRINSVMTPDPKDKESTELLALWYRHIFFTNTSLLFPIKDGILQKEAIFGMLAHKKVYQAFLDSQPDSVMIIPSGRFAVKTLSYKNEVDFNLLHEEALTYLKETNEKLKSAPFTRLITSYLDTNQDKVNVFDFYLPLI